MSKWDGSSTHVRYGHGAGTSSIALVCPRCGREAIASLPCAALGVALIADLSPEWRAKQWRVACTACAHRAGPFGYQEMRGHAPLYFTLTAKGEDLWAWNREHVHLLIEVLRGARVDRHRLGWLAYYVPGRWKTRARHFLPLARRLARA